MKTRPLNSVIALIALAISMLCAAGCNTWKGAGKDVERAGEKMQGDQ